MELNPEKTYVIIDIETTGRNLPDGKIIEIAALKIHNGEHIDTFHSLINPGEKLSWFIIKLTGITNIMLKGAPYFGDIAIEFANFIQGSPIVAHNASFDYRFIKHEMESSVVDYEFNNEKYCTITLARKKYPHLGRYNLDFITEAFSLNNPHRHRAYGDAEATAEFFVKHILC